MSLEQRAVSWWEVVWSQGKEEAIPEFLAPEFVDHRLGEPGVGLRGVEAYRQFHAWMRGALPDLTVFVEQTLAQGDFVVCRWTARGTHTGEGLGVPPTGRSVCFTGLSLTRWEGSRIAEAWSELDQLGLLQQIGALPLLPFQK